MKYLLHDVVPLVAILILLVGLLLSPLVWGNQAQAAWSVPACEPVAATPDITVYYCEPEWGPPIYVNSVGFMLLED